MTLLPISDEQYLNGLRKYYYMILRSKTLEEYNKTKSYGDIITAQGTSVKTDMFTGILISAMFGNIQAVKQEKMREFVQKQYEDYVLKEGPITPLLP